MQIFKITTPLFRVSTFLFLRLHLTNEHTELVCQVFGNHRTPNANQNLIQIYIIPEVALAGAADPPTKADGMKAAAEPAIARRITRRYIVSLDTTPKVL